MIFESPLKAKSIQYIDGHLYIEPSLLSSSDDYNSY